MKKNKVNFDSAMKSFDTMLPDEMKDDYKNSLTICKDANAGEKNACDGLYSTMMAFFSSYLCVRVRENRIKHFFLFQLPTSWFCASTRIIHSLCLFSLKLFMNSSTNCLLKWQYL